MKQANSVDELYDMEFPPQKWLWEGILPQAGSSLLTAKPKIGKSTLLKNLLAAIVRGEPFLGRTTLRGPVMYFGLEENLREMRDQLKLLGVERGMAFFWHANTLLTEKATITFEKTMQELAEINQFPRLIAIDTIQKFTHFRDANDYSETVNAVEPFTAYATRMGCHVLFTHHSNKAKDAETLDTILGSTALAGAVDTLMFLHADKHGIRHLSRIQRHKEVEDDLEPIALAFDGVRYSLGPSKDDEIELELLQLLKNEGSLSHRELLMKMRCDTAKGLSVINRALRGGKVERQGKGIKGDPFVYTLVV